MSNRAYVRALARELVFDAALARDVEQETWLAALESAPRDPGARRGWLAVIVRNVALKAWRSAARRRTHEAGHARARTTRVPTPAEILEREDLHRRLVESLNALDEPYRATLVLRYLENLPPREVGVPVETVRTRIKRGLELLRARLDRASGERGSWCLLFVQGFRLGPPSAWKLAAVLATSSTGVLVMSLLAVCALLPFVWPSAGRHAPVEPVASAPLVLPSAEPWPIVPALVPVGERVAVAASAAGPAIGDEVKIAGRVLDPDGKPQAGADVYLTRWHWDERYSDEALASGRSDAEGRFALSYSKTDRRLAVDAERPEMWQHVTVSAFAPGCGPGWQRVKDVPEGEEYVLALVRDLPVRGRVLDLEGQPVAGARLRVLYLSATSAPENLDGYLEDPGTRHPLLTRYLQPPPAREIACETGADGRFELRGIGRERFVSLDVRGPTVTQAFVRAVTRPIEAVTWEAGDMMSMKETLHGSAFDWIARPTRAVTGVVRDASTRQPLAGVRVTSLTMTGVAFQTSAVETTTGPDGRFRLLGMPKGANNSIRIQPNDEQPYFQQDVAVADPAGMTPVEVEVGLHKGVWITGRLTDGGQPAYGRIHYLPFLDNPYAQKLTTEFVPYNVQGDQHRYKTDADGRFKIVGLPGRAIVGVSAIGSYQEGAGADEIPGADEDGEFKTYANPLPASHSFPTSMRAIEVPVEAASTVCDLELRHGGALTVELVDPQKKPLQHCKVVGRAARSSFDRADYLGPRVEVTNLAADEQRLLRIHQEEHDLGLAVLVSLEDEQRQLVLQPCATIVGRLLDQGGAPIAGVVVRISTLLDWDYDPSADVRSDGEGRFRLEHVVTGVPVYVEALSPNLGPDEEIQQVAAKFEVVPGATKDLGDVRLKVK